MGIGVHKSAAEDIIDPREVRQAGIEGEKPFGRDRDGSLLPEPPETLRVGKGDAGGRGIVVRLVGIVVGARQPDIGVETREQPGRIQLPGAHALIPHESALQQGRSGLNEGKRGTQIPPLGIVADKIEIQRLRGGNDHIGEPPDEVIGAGVRHIRMLEQSDPLRITPQPLDPQSVGPTVLIPRPLQTVVLELPVASQV